MNYVHYFLKVVFLVLVIYGFAVLAVRRDPCLEYPACPDARAPVMIDDECSCVTGADR